MRSPFPLDNSMDLFAARYTVQQPHLYPSGESTMLASEFVKGSLCLFLSHRNCTVKHCFEILMHNRKAEVPQICKEGTRSARWHSL